MEWIDKVELAKNLDKLEKLWPAITYHSVGLLYDCEQEYFQSAKALGEEGVQEFTNEDAFACTYNHALLLDEVLKYFEYEMYPQPFMDTVHRCLCKVCVNKFHLPTGEHLGAYRKGFYGEGISAEDISSAMKKLFYDIEDVSQYGVLPTAAYLHCYIITTQPYAMGNDLVARVMMNVFLIMHGHSPIIIFREYRGEYMSAIDDFVRMGHLDTLVYFLERQAQKTDEFLSKMS